MLSRELKSLRVLNGLTQKELAEKLEMSETSYTKRENGQIPFSIDEIKKMKLILSLSYDDLIRIFFTDEVAFNATNHYSKSMIENIT